MRKYNIIQVGSFDVENYGDLLFPVVFEHEIKKRLNLDNLYLFSPNGGRMPFYGREVYSTAELDEFCAKHEIDGIVVGGGDTVRLDSKVLKDYPESFIPSLSMWQYPIFIANKYKLPVTFNCPGVPLDFGVNQTMVDYTIELCPYLSVRDRNAKNTFSAKNAKRINVVLDSVNLIDEVYPKKTLKERFLKLKNENKIKERFVVLQVNNIQGNDERFIKNLAELVDLINRKYSLQVVFSPIGYVHDDLECLKKIYACVKAPKNNVVVTQKMSPEDMLALFSHSAGFIGTSLHGLVTSNVYHVPILGIDTQSRNKISGYAELCGIENRLVHNISEVKEVFEAVFFEKMNYARFETERIKIIKHFDKIADLIKDQVIEKDTGQILRIFDEFYKINQFNPRSIFVNYIVDGVSKTRFVYGPKENAAYRIDNDFNSEEIHISFFNHSAVKIKKVKATSGKKRLSFEVSNYLLERRDGSKIYLYPTIIIKNTSKISHFDFEIDFEFCDPTTLANMLSQLRDGYSVVEVLGVSADKVVADYNSYNSLQKKTLFRIFKKLKRLIAQ